MTAKAVRCHAAHALSHSSFVGLSRLSSSSTSLHCRLFWLLVFIGGTIGFSFNFLYLFRLFQAGETFASSVPDAAPFTWPDITFCKPALPLPLLQKPYLLPKWRALFEKVKKLTVMRNLRKTSQIDTLHNSVEMIALASLDPKEFHLQSSPDAIRVVRVMEEPMDQKNAFKAFSSFVKARSINPKRGFFTRWYKSLYPCHTFQLSRYIEAHNQTQVRIVSSLIRALVIQRAQSLFQGWEPIKEMAISHLDMKYYHAADDYKNFNSMVANTLKLYITPPMHSVTSSVMSYHIPVGHEVRLFLRSELHKRVQKAHGVTCVQKPFEFEEYDVSMTNTTRFIGSLQVRELKMSDTEHDNY